MVLEIKSTFKVGSKCIVAHDGDLRGAITFGSGTILHPRVTMLALSGPIIIGSGCIFEENVAIINRLKTPMIIGDGNLFQVGCRIESPSIGSHNTFGIRCRTTANVSVGSYCTIGAGCVVLCSPFGPPSLPFDHDPIPTLHTSDHSQDRVFRVEEHTPNESGSATDVDMDVDPTEQKDEAPVESDGVKLQERETLPDFTVVYGIDNRRRLWSGEGQGQNKALHAKHLVYLTETLPKFHKLRVFV